MGTINSKAFILHGWTYSTEKWQPFIDLLKQKGVEANILKIPGLTEDLNRVWTIEDYVSWLKKITDKTKDKIILIGHSNGGRIALNFAIKYPQNLDKLILIDSAGIYHDDLIIQVKRLMFKSISKLGKKLTSSEKLRGILYKIVGEGDYKIATPIMKQTMVNLIDSDKFLNLDKVTVPTLIIWGENDKVTPLTDGKLMHKLIKNSKLYIIHNARHSPQFTHAEEITDIIFKAVGI